jgi:cell wall-associated NlpC family hydrolase
MTASYTRQLYFGCSGADVRYIKDALFELGYYPKGASQITNDIFGIGTVSAVISFQQKNGLAVNGKIDLKTWEAIVAASGRTEVATPSTKAQELVDFARSRIGDIYAWAACDLYPITESWIRAHDKSKAYANRTVAHWQKKRGYGMTDLRAFDCSGLPSACLISQGIIERKYDCDGLYSICVPIKAEELLPGDLCFRVNTSSRRDKTHVGVYAGQGRVVHAKGRDSGVVLEGIYQNGAKWWHEFARIKAYIQKQP